MTHPEVNVKWGDPMSRIGRDNSPKVEVTDSQVYYRFSDGSTIKFTPGEFEERTCKEDFILDSPYMAGLFNHVSGIVVDRQKRLLLPFSIEQKYFITVYIFNRAYSVLSQIFEENKEKIDIDIDNRKVPYIGKVFNVKMSFVSDLIYSLAYKIYKVTCRFYSEKRYKFASDFITYINSHSIHREIEEFEIPYITTDPICFGKIRSKAQKAEEDPFDASIKQVVEAYNKLKTLNKENSEQLESEKKKNVELETKVADLEDRIKNYDVQVQQQELKIQILEKYKEKKTPSADGVSLDAMSKYALGLAKDNEVQVLIDFMNHLIMENVYPVDVLRPLIKKLNEHKHKIQNPVLQQVNNFHSGSSFNDIHNNDNSNIHTNGRR